MYLEWISWLFEWVWWGRPYQVSPPKLQTFKKMKWLAWCCRGSSPSWTTLSWINSTGKWLDLGHLCYILQHVPLCHFLWSDMIEMVLIGLYKSTIAPVHVTGHSIKCGLESWSGALESWSGVLEWNFKTKLTWKLYYLSKLWHANWIAHIHVI